MSKQLLAKAMIAVGVILIISSLVFWRAKEFIANSNEVNLPKSLADLPLTTVIYGPEAVHEITRLHGKEFPSISGAMGTYGNSNQATLWVAGFTDNSTAAQILHAMQEKIASVDTPFTPTGEEQIGGRIVYLLDGMGQKHIYFQSNSLVIWLAADPNISERAIEQILMFFP